MTKKPKEYKISGPNLDGMTEHDLRQWVINHHRLDVDVLMAMFDGLTMAMLKSISKEVTRAAMDLRKYASTKLRAMRVRKAGLITQALELEDQCDAIYGKLPEWAQW